MKKSRRSFLAKASLGLGSGLLARLGASAHGLGWADENQGNGPLVISTWDAGLRANLGAWKILSAGGSALDAVEKGVMVTELEQNCCVGLGANPDRDGIVTLDACIMDHQFNCGSVAALERIKHPVSVARLVMEKTPHVMLVGPGAQQFALSEGFPLESAELSPAAAKSYQEWLKKSEYKPAINRENLENKQKQQAKQTMDPNYNDVQQTRYDAAPARLSDGSWNHDTIGMIALDAQGNLSGSCTTSGMGFKMRGRVGDSPIIGSGLYVDNEVGAAVATGQGEDIIRMSGAHAIIELMRQGMGPQKACEVAMQRLLKIKGLEKAKQIQAGFIAIAKDGSFGGYGLQPGFSFSVKSNSLEKLVPAGFLIKP
ncbi:MAG: glycosylasparaginase, partial [Sphingobacteriia bacterium]